MQFDRLPFRSALAAYEIQAEELFGAWKAGDPAAIEFFRTKHPRFRDAAVSWLPRRVPPEEVRSAPFDITDAKLAIARWYDFRDWPALAEWVEAVAREG